MERVLDAEEKLLLAQGARERAEIVEKYDKGGEGVEIDPWEDPAYEVYHVTDRYGFIHDKPLPKLTNAAETKIEVERKEKWAKMLKKWPQSYGTDKFFKRLYKGLPEALRGHIWGTLLKVPQIKSEQKGVYEDMKQKARRWCTDIRQIDLDVNRTYRNHIMFRKRYDVKQQSLFHILAAYSIYNREVGYCQGMSQIAAILLMYMNEEDAFWGLSELLTDQKHAMHGFFIPGFPKLLRFQDHHDKIVKKFLPRLKKHLAKNDMYSSIYTIKWFMQCFLDRVPFAMAMRLWDIYMYEGERLLVAMSYNILKMHKKRLLRMDMDQLMSFFQGGLAEDFGYNGNKMIESLISCAEKLKESKMDLPPPATINELPTKPFGYFEVPNIEDILTQMRRADKQSDSGASTSDQGGRGEEGEDGKNRPSIPPDGGPEIIPANTLKRLTLQRALEDSYSVLDDTATFDGTSSRASITDKCSSDVESVDTSIAGDFKSSLLNIPDNPFITFANNSKSRTLTPNQKPPCQDSFSPTVTQVPSESFVLPSLPDFTPPPPPIHKLPKLSHRDSKEVTSSAKAAFLSSPPVSVTYQPLPNHPLFQKPVFSSLASNSTPTKINSISRHSVFSKETSKSDGKLLRNAPTDRQSDPLIEDLNLYMEKMNNSNASLRPQSAHVPEKPQFFTDSFHANLFNTNQNFTTTPLNKNTKIHSPAVSFLNSSSNDQTQPSSSKSSVEAPQYILRHKQPNTNLSIQCSSQPPLQLLPHNQMPPPQPPPQPLDAVETIHSESVEQDAQTEISSGDESRETIFENSPTKEKIVDNEESKKDVFSSEIENKNINEHKLESSNITISSSTSEGNFKPSKIPSIAFKKPSKIPTPFTKTTVKQIKSNAETKVVHSTTTSELSFLPEDKQTVNNKKSNKTKNTHKTINSSSLAQASSSSSIKPSKIPPKPPVRTLASKTHSKSTSKSPNIDISNSETKLKAPTQTKKPSKMAPIKNHTKENFFVIQQ